MPVKTRTETVIKNCILCIMMNRYSAENVIRQSSRTDSDGSLFFNFTQKTRRMFLPLILDLSKRVIPNNQFLLLEAL